MVANIHTYMHKCMDTDALDLHTYKQTTKYKSIHTYTYVHADIHIYKQTFREYADTCTHKCMLAHLHIKNMFCISILSLYIYIYIYMHIYIHIHIYTHTDCTLKKKLYFYIHTYVHADICIYRYVNTHICLYINTCIRSYI